MARMRNFSDLRQVIDYEDYEIIEGNLSYYHPYEGTPPEVDMATNKYLIGFGSALVVWIVLSNLLLMISILASKKFKEHPVRLLIINLCIADFLVGCLVIPFALHHQVEESWKLGLAACRAWIFMDWLLGCISMYGLLMLNFDRFLFALRPGRYAEWLQERARWVVMVMLLLPWLLAGVVAIPLTTDAESAQTDHIMTLEVCTSGSSAKFMIGSSIALFFLPILLVIVMNITTVVLACRNTRATYMANYPAHAQEILNLTHNNVQQAKRESIIITLVNLIYIIMWCPYFSLVIMLGVSDCEESCPSPVVFMVMYWVAYANSGVNPILWLLFSDVRRCVKQSLCCLGKYSDTNDLAITNLPKRAVLNDYTAMANSSSTETMALDGTTATYTSGQKERLMTAQQSNYF